MTPVTGAVVLEQSSDYKAKDLDPGNYKDAQNDTYRGLHQRFKDDLLGNLVSNVAQITASRLGGAPVVPHYGQSNEVGQLADYGYGTARDILRVVTLFSLFISVPLGLALMGSKNKQNTSLPFFKGVALMILIPLTVHWIGTFFINNFGGLGAGL